MKYLPLLALIGAPAFAEPVATEVCGAIGDLAEEVMGAYTVGVPLEKALEATGGNQLITEIIMDAYDEPRYSSDEVIAETTFDFRNKWEHACFQMINDK